SSWSSLILIIHFSPAKLQLYRTGFVYDHHGAAQIHRCRTLDRPQHAAQACQAHRSEVAFYCPPTAIRGHPHLSASDLRRFAFLSSCQSGSGVSHFSNLMLRLGIKLAYGCPVLLWMSCSTLFYSVDVLFYSRPPLINI